MFIVMNDLNKTGLITANVSSFNCQGNTVFINMVEFDKPTIKMLFYENEVLMYDDMETLGQEIRDFLEMSTFKDIEEPNKVGYITDAVGDTSSSYVEEDDYYEEDTIGFKIT